MDNLINDQENQSLHSEDIQDIITALPSWVLKWGITVFFFVLGLILGLSALIKYPEIVMADITIESPDAPKPIIARASGKLTKLLIKDNENVRKGQVLAFVESTANHQTVLNLLDRLIALQHVLASPDIGIDHVTCRIDLTGLGELQLSYQEFIQAYLNYKASITNGFLIRKKGFLKDDLENLLKQQNQLNAQKEIEIKDYSLAVQELQMHQKLMDGNVETKAEFRSAQSRYLSKKTPLIQTEEAILISRRDYKAKEKEILELNNQIIEEKDKFLQSTNSLVSQTQEWKNKFVVVAPESGKITFAGIVQENQFREINSELFYINPGCEHYFGEMHISQNNISKIKLGEEVLMKLKSYPFEQYGLLHGRIKTISDVPLKDSIFISQVDLRNLVSTDMGKRVHLKRGMKANAEIVTNNATVFQRIFWAFKKATVND